MMIRLPCAVRWAERSESSMMLSYRVEELGVELLRDVCFHLRHSTSP